MTCLLFPAQLMPLVARCKALGGRSGEVPPADVADITASVLAAVASADVCEHYCTAIVRVCEASEKNRVACGPGVVTALLAMMEAHLQAPQEARSVSAVALEAVCSALRKLVEHADCAAVMKAGGRAAALLQQVRGLPVPGDGSLWSLRNCAAEVLMWL